MALLARKPTPLSPERAALAEAIANHRAHAATREAVANMASSATSGIALARRAVSLAEDGVLEAQAAAGRFLIATAKGEASEAPRTVRQARDDLTDALDNLAAAEVAQAAAQTELEGLSDYMSTTNLKRAAVAVLQADGASAALAVAAEVGRLQQELSRHGQLLNFLVATGAFAVSDRVGMYHGQPADEAVRIAHERLNSPPSSWRALTDRTDAAAPWRAALEALEGDATAPLPSVTAIGAP
ncbi:hypothetical protein HN018_02860 [Lichenicola cladoniae]|uniref:Uncharacterized protein n=1 Tax=Lichenicola cladoniae TaxID=1484109 RepID=A0A6M8HLC3_9PROT|nr:hypothetical protein [Lichenicola cladoniae]NPD68924.1 hypothetical protein [Acetobacteraceae bacterium]QKE89130.1 hypothetical protein HN018_02860 [Lichenicola cladoniae]